MPYRHSLGQQTYHFRDLRELMARATPRRSGDELAGVAASSQSERVAAQWALSEVPLRQFLQEALVPYENDEVTRLIMDSHDASAFAPIASLTVGEFRDWLLSAAADSQALANLQPGLTPEMVAAVSKIMRLQDLVTVAAKCQVVTAFRNTIGLSGTFSTRLQPNHPTDSLAGITASILDGLLLGNGDAVIGINPVSDSTQTLDRLLHLLDDLRQRFEIPTQTCVLSHVTSTLDAIHRGSPVDLVFQSIAGTQAANTGFGVHLSMLKEARDAAMSLKRGTVGDHVMYFETGQGSCLSAGAHFGVDQQTLEARAYAVARQFKPLLVNTVVGFIGPEYLYDGKQIIRAGLEDHFCGKLLGLPMGCDICYTNHAEADQDDLDMLLVQFVAAGGTFIMGIPGSDDVMLNYQTTSFQDAAAMRKLFKKRPSPEFAQWLETTGLVQADGQLTNPSQFPAVISRQLALSGGDTWERLRACTPARIGLGKLGEAIPTKPHLAFQQDHAQARDAVHHSLTLPSLEGALSSIGLETISLKSAAPNRPTYLRRPDLGRCLSPEGCSQLQHLRSDPPVDIVIVIADGLSPKGVEDHAPLLVEKLVAGFHSEGWTLGPLCLASQARVALGDEVGNALGARLCVMLIGERPGLSASDSVGLYLTMNPAPGRLDSERNCLSNIRPGGMDFDEAAATCCHLIRQAFQLGLTGTALKDERQTIEADDNRLAIPYLKPLSDRILSETDGPS